MIDGPVTHDGPTDAGELVGKSDNHNVAGIVTLSEIVPIWTTYRQAKPLKSNASKSAVVGKFQ